MTHNLAVWMQNAGYRTIHIGKFLNGYGDKPYDDGKAVPPGWSSWHTILNADTNHYFYGYLMNNNGTIDGPYGDSGSWETREYGVRDDIGCPFAPTNGLPCYYETDHADRTGDPRNRRNAGRTALLPAARLHRPARRLPPPGRARAGAAPLRLVQGGPPPPRPLRRLRRGQRQGQAALHPRSAATSRLNDKHTYRVYWQKQLEALRAVDDGVKLIIDTLGGVSRLRNTYVHLHLRQRLLLRRAPADRRQVPRLRAGHPPALPDPRPGHQAGHPDRRAASQIDIAPTILELAGAERRQEHRRPLDGPLPARPGPAHPAAAALRVLRRDQRRRPGGRRRTPPADEPAPSAGPPTRAMAARPPRSSPRRRTTRESASAPTSTSPGRPGRRSSTTSTRTRTSSTTWPRSPTSSRSATTSTPCSPAESKKPAASRTASAAPAANRP